MFKLAPLPYKMDSLEPYISRKTLEFHYGKHHQGYIDKLNALTRGTPFEDMKLLDVIQATHEENPKVFNNAAQAWNHEFFWNCMTPDPHVISKRVEGILVEEFGSLHEFKMKFSTAAKNLFGSGWVWLSRSPRGGLRIDSLPNAETPVVQGSRPLLALDVWEHAYYLDYQNDRAKFIETFFTIVNWNFLEENLESTLSTQSSSMRFAHSPRGGAKWDAYRTSKSSHSSMK